MLALFVLFTGCGKIQERPPRVNQLPAVESEGVGVVVKDGIIYYNREKRGSVTGEKITVIFGDKEEITLEGEPGKLMLGGIIDENEFSQFTYDDLHVTTRICGPYMIYRQVKNPTYACDGSFMTDNEGNQEPHYYCDTNGKDYISQYEFNGVTSYCSEDGTGFATGGEVTKTWNKMYMKKINGKNIYIFGMLKQDFIDLYEAKEGVYQNTISKKYLDTLLSDNENKETVKKWDTIVQSLE